jgi:heme/copper-type cytochrome/quinol oxidase subunit 2
MAEEGRFRPDRITVNQGDSVTLELRSLQGSHGFYLPELGLDVVLYEGMNSLKIDIDTDNPGTYEYTCGSVCAPGDEGMRGTFTIRPR